MTKSTIIDTAAGLAEAAAYLALHLLKAPACRKHGGRPCLRPEVRVPFGKIDYLNLCDACAALWHVSVAEIALRRRAHEDAEDEGIQ